MPVHSYTVKAGSQGRALLIFGRGPDGGPAVGIKPAELGAAYVRDDGSRAIEIDRPVVEVDGRLAPGIYRLEIPDEVLTDGATRAVVVVRHATAHFDPAEFDLVMYDPQDSVRLGMTALGPEGRLAALRGAFPRLSELELKERAAMTNDAE